MRDSVRIAFSMAAVKFLHLLFGDAQSVHMNAPTSENVLELLGQKSTPSWKGKPVLVVQELYGLQSSGARLRDNIVATLRDGIFKNYQADPDVYMRSAVKPTGFKYLEYVLIYVDDILVICNKPHKVTDMLSRTYKLKGSSARKPTECLGVNIKEYQLPVSGNETHLTDCWSLLLEVYVKRAVVEVERLLGDDDQKLKTKGTTLLSSGYRPEVDATLELDDRQANYFQGP
jgi:hypothetical protein